MHVEYVCMQEAQMLIGEPIAAHSITILSHVHKSCELSVSQNTIPKDILFAHRLFLAVCSHRGVTSSRALCTRCGL